MITKFFLALSLILLPCSVFSESSTVGNNSEKLVRSICQQLDDQKSMKVIAEALFNDYTPEQIELITEVARLHKEGLSIAEISAIIQQSNSADSKDKSKSLISSPKFWVAIAVATGASIGLCYLLYQYSKQPAPQNPPPPIPPHQNNNAPQPNIHQPIDPQVQQALAQQQEQALAQPGVPIPYLIPPVNNIDARLLQDHLRNSPPENQWADRLQEGLDSIIRHGQNAAAWHEFNGRFNEYDLRIHNLNDQINIEGDQQRRAQLEQQQRAFRREQLAYVQYTDRGLHYWSD